MADLIVLGGCAAVEAGRRGRRPSPSTVPFTPGRTDASQEQTDVASFAVLEPRADGFRNYLQEAHTPSRAEAAAGGQGAAADAHRARDDGARRRPARARRQRRTASKHGVFTNRPSALTNDFFVNLLDMAYGVEAHVGGDERSSRAATARPATSKWTATRVDLVFGSNSQLRALAEVYAAADAKAKFVTRLRRRVDQGHGRRPHRPHLIALSARVHRRVAAKKPCIIARLFCVRSSRGLAGPAAPACALPPHAAVQSAHRLCRRRRHFRLRLLVEQRRIDVGKTFDFLPLAWPCP